MSAVEALEHSGLPETGRASLSFALAGFSILAVCRLVRFVIYALFMQSILLETFGSLYVRLLSIPQDCKECQHIIEGLKMKTVEVKDVHSKPNPHGVDARSISDTESAQVVHITLQPGESLKKHITPVDVVFYVLEGRGVVEIGEERKEVGRDTLIESPARIPHRWMNESAGPVRILVVKTPRPKEATKLL
jgi:mannose-6-phosphate isomerase-like protein (cupin superfamily)